MWQSLINQILENYKLKLAMMICIFQPLLWLRLKNFWIGKIHTHTRIHTLPSVYSTYIIPLYIYWSNSVCITVWNAGDEWMNVFISIPKLKFSLNLNRKLALKAKILKYTLVVCFNLNNIEPKLYQIAFEEELMALKWNRFIPIQTS